MADELAALRAELARKEAALEVASLKEQLAVQDALAQQPPPEEDAGLPTVAELIQAMRAPDDELRGEAITYLCELVDCAFGDDGALLGQAVRDANGVAMLSWMLADASPRVQTQTLLILGNLCSDSFDPESWQTKALLLQSGAERALFRCVLADEYETLLYACAALQNLCHSYEWAQVVAAHGLQPLEELLAHDDGRVVRYASGALKNCLDNLAAAGAPAPMLKRETAEVV